MQKIVTNLWFDGRVEEALEFYTSVFPDSKVKSISRYTDVGPGPKGEIMTALFELAGQQFVIINGGPEFPQTPAMSLQVNCQGQPEVDELWDTLSEGGEKGQCGWLTDRFGVSWQVVPAAAEVLLLGADEAATDRVMAAMLKMTKINLAELEAAYAGE